MDKKNKFDIEKNVKDLANKYFVNKTYEAQGKYGFDIKNGTYNNEADAFKHTFMQWALTYFVSEEFAKRKGDEHEAQNIGNPAGERNMDLWNNAIGRELAKEMKNNSRLCILDISHVQDIAAQKIYEKMQNGELITNPNDKRKFENMEIERLSDTDKVYSREEFEALDDKTKSKVRENYFGQIIENNWKIPSKADLDNQVKSGELIYVDDYTKGDGTKVSGYYRRRRK